MHNRAEPAAEAANCANAQGKFWEYHDKLFANQRALTDDDLKKYAAEVGLDTDKFNECYASREFQADIRKDQAEGSKVGVTGTPAMFINGRFFSGAQPFDKLKPVIDEELAR